MAPRLVLACALPALWIKQGFAVVQAPDFKLPDVEAVMTKASDKMDVFKAQTDAMKATVAAKQQERQEVMAARKKELENQLRDQEQQNQAVANQNAVVQTEIKEIQERNLELRNEVVQLAEGNTMIRKTITDLQGKMQMASDFLAETIRITEKAESQTAQVLSSMDAKPTLSKFLNMAGSVREQVGVRRKPVRLMQYFPATPGVDHSEGFVQHLSKSFAELVDAEQEGETLIEEEFHRLFQQGLKEYQRLVKEQKTLRENRTALKQKTSELEAARSQTLKTQEMLQQRLYGVRIFARKVDAEAAETYGAIKPNPDLNPVTALVEVAGALPYSANETAP